MRLAPAAMRMAFTVESAEEMRKIVTMFQQIYTYGHEADLPDMDYTRGHFKRGVK